MGELPAIEPPFWACLMAQEYRHAGKQVAILDAEAERLSQDETNTRIKNLMSDEIIIVVMGNNPSVSSTPKMADARALALSLTRESTPVKLTGLHPMAVPELTERETGCQVIQWTPKVETSPAYDLIDLSLYRAHNWHCLEDIDNRFPYAVVATSYGCPFFCSYCNIHTLYEKRFQKRSVEDVIRDLGVLAKRGVRHIKFWDELFAFRESRVLDICDSIIASGWRFNIWAYARPDTVSQKTLKVMKDAGINWLAYGFDDKCRRGHIRRTVTMTHDAGINIIGNFMYGLEGSDNGIGDFARSLNIEWANFYTALPYPGSSWYKEQSSPITDWGWYNQYREGLNPARDKAFNDFFSDPEYQARIEKQFGRKAVEHIRQMLCSNIRKEPIMGGVK